MTTTAATADRPAKGRASIAQVQAILDEIVQRPNTRNAHVTWVYIRGLAFTVTRRPSGKGPVTVTGPGFEPNALHGVVHNLKAAREAIAFEVIRRDA